MSKTKKAVIIGSVLVGIGVIIGFIGIAIGGFKFPNGAVDLTTMKALHTEKKTAAGTLLIIRNGTTAKTPAIPATAADMTTA